MCNRSALLARASHPYVLLEEAKRRLHVPLPTPELSPSVDVAHLVGMPEWLAIDPAGFEPHDATAAVPGLSVTLSATPLRTVWDLGNGDTVTCDGAGTPWQPGSDSSTVPSCGYVYQVSSTASQPDGVYHAAVTTVWSRQWGCVPGLRRRGPARPRPHHPLRPHGAAGPGDHHPHRRLTLRSRGPGAAPATQSSPRRTFPSAVRGNEPTSSRRWGAQYGASCSLTAAAERIERGRCGRIGGHDDGGHRRAPARVRAPHDRHLGHSRHGRQDPLDRVGPDVLPTGDDQIAGAAEHLQPTGRVVPGAEVAGGEPAAGQERVELIGAGAIGAQQQIAPQLDLPGLGDPDLDPVERDAVVDAARAGLGEPVGRHDVGWADPAARPIRPAPHARSGRRARDRGRGASIDATTDTCVAPASSAPARAATSKRVSTVSGVPAHRARVTTPSPPTWATGRQHSQW